ncbi:MAG TPA: D-alanine--D-alanine ligase family protein [Pyrinomonadaceae bacterium]|nr:D-alanine--D-alanine ligase family protein [Pyrinomonadaceae bacterium]
MKQRIGIIFGGRSGEHEISIRSAKTVIEQIDHEKYEVVPLAIGPEGNWISPEKAVLMLADSAASLIPTGPLTGHGGPVAMIGDTRYKGITAFAAVAAESFTTPLDVVFPVLHGTFGEDGTIQGIFEMADIPYVGCGVLASACGMDKVVMKTLFREAKLPMCGYVWFLRSEWENGRDALVKHLESKIQYPCFVKPANLGSSVGVSMVNDRASLEAAIDLAAEYDRKIIVEEGLQMREIECSVLGNDEPEASLPGEYLIRDPSKVFLDYTEKYSGTGNNEFIVPAPLSGELTQKIQKMAIDAFKAIDGSGLARVDFFLRKDNGTLLVNEINTMPGLTDASGFPKMWAGTGKSFPDVIERLIELAIERHRDRARNKTSREA